jgi:hypothetical protein
MVHPRGGIMCNSPTRRDTVFGNNQRELCVVRFQFG